MFEIQFKFLIKLEQNSCWKAPLAIIKSKFNQMLKQVIKGFAQMLLKLTGLWHSLLSRKPVQKDAVRNSIESLT